MDKTAAGTTQSRFVKRIINVPLDDTGHYDKEFRILQTRTFEKLGTYHEGVWSEWTDVPLVEPEDEDQDDD